jgi:hypothetical protein
MDPPGHPPCTCSIGSPTCCPVPLTNDTWGYPVTVQGAAAWLVNSRGMIHSSDVPCTNPTPTLRLDDAQAATVAAAGGGSTPVWWIEGFAFDGV